jgi:hypothetical protein
MTIEILTILLALVATVLAILQAVSLYLSHRQKIRYERWFSFPDPKDVMSMSRKEVINILKEQDRYSPRWLEDLLDVLQKKDLITSLDLPYIVRIQLEERKCLRKRLAQLTHSNKKENNSNGSNPS